MSQNPKKAAADHANLAGKQLKHAAHNATEAVELGAEHVKDETVEALDRASNLLPIVKHLGGGLVWAMVAGVAIENSVHHLKTASELIKNR